MSLKEIYGDITASNVQEHSKLNRDAVQKLFKRLKKRRPKDLDATFQELHNEAFEFFDCLECANCCRSLSPIITEKDIDKLGKHFRMKSGAFIKNYLHIDEDSDYVFNDSPCPFILGDNYCMSYESRPKACKEYPHTDRTRIDKIFNITLKNRETCPVVYIITEEILKRY